jgi:predicted HTH transcriptional regulator
MNILFAFIFVAGFATGWVALWFLVKHHDSSLSFNHDVVSEPVSHHEESKDRIMVLFNQQQSITNDDIEHLLGVSNTTAWRYLEDLESEGLIEQRGRQGRGVSYERRKETF